MGSQSLFRLTAHWSGRWADWCSSLPPVRICVTVGGTVRRKCQGHDDHWHDDLHQEHRGKCTWSVPPPASLTHTGELDLQGMVGM
eukprot:59369-Chlamydomonas_euryale.AAC.6